MTYVQGLRSLTSLQLRLFRNGLHPTWRSSATSLLASYLRNPEPFWPPISWQASKVRKARARFDEVGIRSPSGLSRRLVDLVNASKGWRDNPVFVMGTGGSGSTWLGAMLGELPDLEFGREIYIPDALKFAYREGSEIAGDAIWACMLLNTWALNRPDRPFTSDFVNNARSINCYDIYRRIWPMGRFVYLTRDPRDQILSATYRKPRYRQLIASGASDEEFLLMNAKKYMSIHRHYGRARDDSIYLMKYEDLVSDTEGEMMKLLGALRIECAKDRLEQAIFEHDASNMRKGKVAWKGNLGTRSSTGWRDSMSPRERDLCRPLIQPALEELGYETDASW